MSEARPDPYIAAHCFEGERDDEILFEPLKADNTVMFRIQGQATNHCYDLYNWGDVIKADAMKKVSIWIPEETPGCLRHRETHICQS
jgi:hypothetical protein